MKRKMTALMLMALVSSSCIESDESNKGIIANESSMDSQNFETNMTLADFTLKQEEKLEEATEIIKLVVGTEEFKEKVIGHTNADVYQKILEGAERLQPVINHQMDLEVELYQDSNSNTVAYTKEETKRIWINSKFFHSYSTAGMAHVLFHEWLIKLGYKNSIPDVVASILGEIGKDFL